MQSFEFLWTGLFENVQCARIPRKKKSPRSKHLLKGMLEPPPLNIRLMINYYLIHYNAIKNLVIMLWTLNVGAKLLCGIIYVGC